MTDATIPGQRRDASASFDDLPGALAWLDSHVNFESTMPSRRALPTLDRMADLMSVLADPHRTYPVVHITGTNGKGSTAAMVTEVLVAHGLSVGTYTSPNLTRVNERIARNGEPIDDATLVAVLAGLAAVEPMVAGQLTRFELLTAAAYAWFADEAVDAAVVEVGVGGRWDCTNVVDSDVAVVTNISFDHTDVLGPTLVDIATDKSGIFKPSSRVVIGETDPAIASLLAGAARQVGAESVWVRPQDVRCRANRMAVGGRLVDIETPLGRYDDLFVPLHGAHQGDNAAVAVAAAEAFFGSALDPAVVSEGLAAVTVPGRLEVIGRHPLVVIDGAHNVAGMTVLSRALVEEFAVPGAAVAVVGMLRGRDPVAMLEQLLSAGVRSVVVCEPDSPRALPAEVVAEAGAGLGLAVEVVGDVGEAVSMAVGRAMVDDLVIVCGSFYVVGAARAALLAVEH